MLRDTNQILGSGFRASAAMIELPKEEKLRLRQSLKKCVPELYWGRFVPGETGSHF